MTTTPTPTPFTAAPSRALSIISLAAAVGSIAFGQVFFLPIIAIVLGFVARSREPEARNISIWGIILGFVVLFWWVIVALVTASLWAPLLFLHIAH